MDRMQSALARLGMRPDVHKKEIIAMMPFKYVILVLLAISLCGRAWAGLEKTNEAPEQLRIEIDLTDGSCIKGLPSIRSVPFRTSYATMDIPLDKLAAIKLNNDHETAAIDLQNGDKLKGVITLGTIKLETVFGKVSIGMEHISVLRVESLSVEASWNGWQFSGDSVAVDPERKWLRIQADGNNSDQAFKDIALSLPVVLEARARLVRGGQNYTLPWIIVFCGTQDGAGGRINCGSLSQGLPAQWLIFLNTPGWPTTISPVPSAKPARGENVWVTIRAVVEKEKGRLYAKHDDESAFTLVAEQQWPAIDTNVKRIAVEQPWDAVCDIDYVKISERVAK